MVSESLQIFWVNHKENTARFRPLLPTITSPILAFGNDAAYSCLLWRKICQQLHRMQGIQDLVAQRTMATAHVKSFLTSDILLTVQEPWGMHLYSPMHEVGAGLNFALRLPWTLPILEVVPL